MIKYVKLGEICKILNGFAFKSEKYMATGIRVVRITNVQKGYIEDADPEFYPLEEQKNIEKYMLYEGDLLISLTGNVGRVAVLQKELLPAALNQRVACLRISDAGRIYKPYLFHYLNSDYFEQQCIMSAKGVAQKNMSTEWLKEYEIPLPTIEKQREIAEIFSRIDELISGRKQQTTILEQTVKSRFIEMFGDVITNTKGWKQYVFTDVASSRLGKMLDAKQQTGNNSFPYLANFNVQWFKFDLSSINQMDFDEDERVEFELKEGDLLVCEGGEIGRCAVWHNEMQSCYFQKALHRVRCNTDLINPNYMAWWFKYNCEHNGFAAIEGAKATIAHLPGAKLKLLSVTTPPIELQDEFAAFVEQVDKSKYIEKILVRVLAIFGKKYIFGNRMNSVFMKIRDFYMNLLKKILLGAVILVLCACGNPILGKWKATSGGELLASVGCGEVEFTSSKEYSCGMAQDVEYEIDGDKVLVKGALGVSVVYYMQGKNKMYMELLGDRVYWEKIK